MALDHKELVEDILNLLGKARVTRDLLSKNLPVQADRKMQGVSDALVHLKAKIENDFRKENGSEADSNE